MKGLSFFRHPAAIPGVQGMYLAVSQNSTEIVHLYECTPQIERQNWEFTSTGELVPSTAAEFAAAKNATLSLLGLVDQEAIHAAAIEEHEAQQDAKHLLYA